MFNFVHDPPLCKTNGNDVFLEQLIVKALDPEFFHFLLKCLAQVVNMCTPITPSSSVNPLQIYWLHILTKNRMFVTKFIKLWMDNVCIEAYLLSIFENVCASFGFFPSLEE